MDLECILISLWDSVPFNEGFLFGFVKPNATDPPRGPAQAPRASLALAALRTSAQATRATESPRVGYAPRVSVQALGVNGAHLFPVNPVSRYLAVRRISPLSLRSTNNERRASPLLFVVRAITLVRFHRSILARASRGVRLNAIHYPGETTLPVAYRRSAPASNTPAVRSSNGHSLSPR